MTLRIYTFGYLIFLFAPILILPLFAFNDSEIVAFPLTGFTSNWFAELWDSGSEPAWPEVIGNDSLRGLVQTVLGWPVIRQVFWVPTLLNGAVGNSLFIAATSALLATCLGLLTAQAGTRHEFPGKRGILGFIMIPLVLPEIIVAVSLLVVLVQVLGLGLSNWTIIAAHTLLCVPFSVAILNGAFQNIDPALEEAALDLGESRWSAFRRVILPLVMPGVISSLLISFIISLDEFIIAFFLSGSNPTMPVYIWGLLRFPGKIPMVMALGTILVTLSVLLLVIAELFRRRGLRRAGVKDTGGFL